MGKPSCPKTLFLGGNVQGVVESIDAGIISNLCCIVTGVEHGSLSMYKKGTRSIYGHKIFELHCTISCLKPQMHEQPDFVSRNCISFCCLNVKSDYISLRNLLARVTFHIIIFLFQLGFGLISFVN